MHPTAMDNGRRFFATYLDASAPALILDIGSPDINGSLRQAAQAGARYVGLDFAQGRGVDRVLDDPYQLPCEDGVADAVVSSSCFEHVDMFWLTFNEILRVLRPGGLFYLNAPSNGAFHRYPVDCWRFYPDAGDALVRWGVRSGFRPALLESFTTYQHLDIWNDFVAVFVKDAAYAALHPRRMLDGIERYMNGRRYGVEGLLNPQADTEDRIRLQALSGRVGQQP